MVTQLKRYSTGKNILIFTAAMIVDYMVMFFVSLPKVEPHAGGLELFDLSPTGYSFDAATQLLQTLGEEGRAAYLYWQLPPDFLMPVFYSVALSLLLCWLLLKFKTTPGWMFYLCVIPFLNALADYGENFSVMSMLISYPDISQAIVTFASLMTVSKTSLAGISFLLVIIAALAVIVIRPHKASRRAD